MNIKKYFWGLNPQALKEAEKIIKNPNHSKFIDRIYVFLSRCDKPKEVFSLINKQQFIDAWPRIRRYWLKKGQALDFRAWWETVYEQLLTKQKTKKSPYGQPAEAFAKIGRLIKNQRVESGLSQSDLAQRAGMKQPDISDIELGVKNITLSTLIRLCRILKINNLPIGSCNGRSL